MPNPTFSNMAKVTIDGADLTKVLEEARGECWVESSLNAPSAFQIAFIKSATDLMKEFSMQLRIGAKVAVYAIADGQGKDTPLITGLVTALETEVESMVTTTILRGFDHAFKMQRQRRATGYQNMTAAEIIRELAGKDGVDVGAIRPTSPRYENITQPNVSDWEFTQYLAGQSGMTPYFDTEGLLQFRKPSPLGAGGAAATAGLSEAAIDFGTDVTWCRTGITAADQVSTVTSRGWDEDQKSLRLGKAKALSSPDYKIGTTPAQVMAAFGPATRTETGTPYGSTKETMSAASSLAADITSAFAEMEIQVRGWPSLTPGGTVLLKSAGEPFDGTYTLTATRHVFSKHNDYTTWLWVTGRQVRTLYGLAAGGLQPQPRIPGVVNAIVTDINDPKQQGRVKLRFPWFDDDYTTDWVRTVQFGGVGGGGVISPEIEDEVLVAFDRGSMDYPYVIGGLYSNPANKPSEHDTSLVTAPGHLNRRSLVSRTGHRLELLDDEAAAKTGVRLQSGDKGLTVFLEQSQHTITIGSNGTIDVSADGVVTVSSHSRLELRAPQVSIISDQVNIVGATTINGPVKVDGTANITGVLTQEGDAGMMGNVTIGGACEMLGALEVNGALDVDGTLTVDGVTGLPVPVG
jgi:uncharacterized protein involved in type VI secretion and phage assembly